MTDDGEEESDSLNPSDVAEVVQFALCEQFADIRFRDHDDNTTETFPVSRGKLTEPEFSPAPVLTSLGDEYEDDVYDDLVTAAERVRSWDGEYQDRLARVTDPEGDVMSDLDGEGAEMAAERIATAVRDASSGDLDGPAVLLQPSLSGTVGRHDVDGDADLVVVWPDDPEGGDSHIRAYDIKAGEEKPHHQVQATLYALLIEDDLDCVNADYTLTGGIIDGETEVGDLDPEAMPKFAYESRGEDVARMLDEDGFLDRVFHRGDTPPHELGKAAHESGYSEVYFVQAIEERDIRLLNLSLPAQRAFRNVNDRLSGEELPDDIADGIHTLEDVARVVRPPDDPRPYKDVPAIHPRYREVVRELNADPRLDERVQIIAQRAQVILGRLNNSHPNARDDAAEGGEWLQGTGEADLPEDDPPWDADFGEIECGSLIRAYVDVHADYLNDRVLMLSAAVDCGQRDEDPIVVSELVDRVPTGDGDFDGVEGDLVESFVDLLFAAMRRVAFEAGIDDAAYHFYFHTEGEHAQFAEALDRHTDRDSPAALSSLFDLRSAITEDDDPKVEQRMVSYVQDALEDHYAFSEPGMGIVHARDHLVWPDMEFWTHTREDTDGEEVDVNLKRAFRFQCLTRLSGYTRDDDGGLVIDSEADDIEGLYPTLPRDQTQIPLEYFWAAEGIDAPHKDWAVDDDSAGNTPTQYYFRHDTGDGTISLTREDIDGLGNRLALALRDIERELFYCRRPLDHDRLKKKPLPLDTDDLRRRLDSGGPEDSLVRACRDYLDVEHRAEVEELHTLRDQPVRQRVETGRALPIRVNRIASEQEEHDVEAELAYDALDFDDPRRLFSACRFSTGDTALASALTVEGGEIVIDDSDERWNIERSPILRIHDIDLSDDSPIRLKDGSYWVDSDDPYDEWNLSPAFGAPEDGKANIDVGDTLILDEDQMTIFRSRARKMIDGLEGSELYRLLEAVRHGEHDPDDLRTDAFDAESVSEFLDDLDEAAEATSDDEDEEEFVSPNERQRELVETVAPRISLLQGPPGTGKTKGSLAPYLLSRAHSRLANHDRFCGLVTAPTHTAIQEVMQEAVSLYHRCRRHDVGNLGGLTFYRVTGSETPPDKKLGGPVEYVNYNDATSREQFAQVWRGFSDGQTTLGSVGGGAAIVFATPQAIYRIARDIHADSDDVEVADVYADAPAVCDAVAVDEASMMTLPQLFMATPFLDGGQLVVAGDHRQMPPVQQHEWADEDREGTVDALPFLSALNYCRFLRGEEVERVVRNDAVNVATPDADISFTRLRRTYRCHRTVTEFLRRWMYSKDGIDYTSDIDATLDIDEDVPSRLEPVFGDAPLVLITHDDRTSRQRNQTEADLAGKIVQNLPKDGDGDAIGIVTPHNAQKALLQRTESIRAARESDAVGDIPVDTVERFQGGEKETIIISATVSSPAQLDAESDFITNPNRLNVALSRMKKKLVVLAPESLFELIPDDTDAYEDAQIWKGLYQTTASGEPDEVGDVIFDDGSSTRFRVYTFGGQSTED